MFLSLWKQSKGIYKINASVHMLYSLPTTLLCCNYEVDVFKDILQKIGD